MLARETPRRSGQADMRQMIAEDECVAAWYTITRTHHSDLGPFTRTGYKFETREIVISQVHSSKAVGLRNVLEGVQMMQQLSVPHAP